MNTKKIFSSAALAASLTLAAGAAFAWGCGAGPMMGYGPGCQVDPQGAYPGCQYGPNGMMRQGYPCWSYGPQGAQGARDFRPGFEQRKIYLRGALNLTDAQKPAFEAYFGAVDAYHQMNTSSKRSRSDSPGYFESAFSFPKSSCRCAPEGY